MFPYTVRCRNLRLLERGSIMIRTDGWNQRLFPGILFLLMLASFGGATRQAAHARQGGETIPELSTLTIQDKLLFGYFPDGITVEYDKALAIVINQPLEEEYFRETGEYIQKRLITTRLAAADSVVYTVDFTPGLSLDPMFIILGDVSGELKRIGNVDGLYIAFPGDGFFYVTGHTNNCFDQRRKFTVRDGAIVEIRQPFYYVGLQTAAKANIDIYRDTGLTQIVEHIASGTPITVVANDGDFYLIKTPRDILGWTKIDVGQKDTAIGGLFFFGD